MFSQLLDRGCFCDVTLACEGQTIRCHRVVLCACSTYFDSLLTNVSTDKDPIIIMRDCKFSDIKALIEFMYKGEINVEHVSTLRNSIHFYFFLLNNKPLTLTGKLSVLTKDCRGITYQGAS